MQKTLDVRELEPCEPLDQSLAAARELGAGDYLKVSHRRQPNLLFPMLEQLTMEWRCRECAPDHFEVLVWRAGDAIAGAEAALYMSERK